jgi:thioredoxin reductase (NADPH)
MGVMPHGNDIYDITIIGAGPTGLFGAFYAGMRKMRVLLIEALPEMGGQLITLYPEKFIYDVPGFKKIIAKDLVANLIEQAMQFDHTVRLGEQVTSLSYVDEEQRTIAVKTNADTYYAKSVLVAAGIGAFKPNTVNVPGVEAFENKGVCYFVKDPTVFEGKHVMIVGGGDSAVDWALHMHELASSVTLIHRRDGFRAHESSIQALHESPVDVKLFYELQEVHGTDRVERVTIINNQTKETEERNVDAVLLSLGFKADLGPIKSWDISKDRIIPVNPDQTTSMPGVYAAGDVAGTQVKIDLIATGFAQATIAINEAKTFIDPEAKLYPGHSSARSSI